MYPFKNIFILEYQAFIGIVNGKLTYEVVTTTKL